MKPAQPFQESHRSDRYWRSLGELADSKEFRLMRDREFPPGASEWWDGLSRRNFLRMSGAVAALSGLNACTKQPTREIVPYVKQPEELVLGEPLFYATSMLLGGFATGVIVKSREGHPVKVEGNPEHPASLGGSSVWMQASILDLYDPDRSQTVTHDGEISTWASFLTDLNDLLKEQMSYKGAGLRFLTETVTSPTLTAQLNNLLKRFPSAKWHQFEPVNRDNAHEGARLAFGEVLEPRYDFAKAAVVVSLESDFLHEHPERLRLAREFTDGRRIAAGKKEMNRLYVVESTPTITGTMAEHRLAVESGRIAALARELAQEVGASGSHANDGGARTFLSAATSEGTHDNIKAEDRLDVAADRNVCAPAPWLAALVRDLQEHQGASIVIAGESQPPIVHALAHLLNQALGNVGKTVHYIESAEAHSLNHFQSLGELVQDISAGQVDTLIILGGNPVYTAPADLGFDQVLSKIRRSIHLGLEQDETAAVCTWHIPQAHYLETWGDARSFDGTVSLIQPLIAPLYEGKTAHELLGAMTQQQPIRTDYEIVREFWRSQKLWKEFEHGWRKALHDGFIQGTARLPKQVRCRSAEILFGAVGDGVSRLSQAGSSPGQSKDGTPHVVPYNEVIAEPVTNSVPGENQVPPFISPVSNRFKRLRGDIEITFRPDPNLWDGRFANNGWLQECPKPINKLTWDNAILISTALAQMGGLASGDVVELSFKGRTVSGPVCIMPGQARDSITVHLGYGRSRVGRVGASVGFNAYKVRCSDACWSGHGVTITPNGTHHPLVSTQNHHNVGEADRQILRSGSLQDYLAKTDFVKPSLESPAEGETLYNPDEYKYEGYKWGMSIDLTTCIGCNACLVACETENNIPFVGKDQVARHREMHWLRMDTYFKGPADNPEFTNMPVPCMHCEHAPCELVCPVGATVHDHEGLNLQVYNRCIGTRFCSNNCPYKVRRFNFLRYTDYELPNYKPMYNPEVTVRWRGVMEKCNYCVQRISAARITAEKENRRIRDGEVLTACQQACPTQAIVFGDLNNRESKVAKLKAHPLDYSMLGQLNTRPRTTYLAKLTNPNSEGLTPPQQTHAS
ncbi:MAG: molybdopterin oxidoreductase [Verrucomicrobia bacterium]|nr:MAG: molybdopterin oxidoreductase [Verrucomicrobiota bacterium]